MVPQPPAVVPGQGTQLEMPDIPKVKLKLKVKPKESKEKPKELVSKEKTKNLRQAKLREKPRRQRRSLPTVSNHALEHQINNHIS